MIDLNFINPDEQSEMKNERTVMTIRDLLAFAVITIAIVAGIFLTGNNIMQQSIADITKSSTSVKIQHSGINDTIQKINAELKDIEQIQKDYNTLSDTLAQIGTLVNKGNKLTNLTWNTIDNIVTLEGQSNTREDLLSLKNALEQSDLTSNVDLPISNLLSRKNIDFALTVTLTK